MSGGLKFLKLLSKKNLETLERALDPDAEPSDRFMGNKVIKDLVARGAEMLPRPRKPGPKKEQTTNSTDEELRRLIENVRGIMGLSAKVSRLKTLDSLYRFIAYASDVCTAHCFITRAEYDSLRLYFTRLKDLADPQDEGVVSALSPLFEKGSNRFQDFPTLEELAYESSAVVGHLGSATWPSPKLETKVFYQLASVLEMVAPDSKAKSYQDYGLSRGGILRAGLARLSHLKQLFKAAELAIDGDLISALHLEVRDSFVRNLNNRGIYEQIETLLQEAMRRQAIHPLRRFEMENLDFTPKTFEEGESYPGGHYGGIMLDAEVAAPSSIEFPESLRSQS